MYMLCPTLCDSVDCSTLGLPVPHHLQSLPTSCPFHWWCHPAISSSDALYFFCPQSFPVSGTFPKSQLFSTDDQNTEVSPSASVLPIQDWFPLRLTDLTSLLSRGLSVVFSSTAVWRHQFFGTPPSLQLSSHNCTRPLGSLDHVGFCWQNNVSAFQHNAYVYVYVNCIEQYICSTWFCAIQIHLEKPLNVIISCITKDIVT